MEEKENEKKRLWILIYLNKYSSRGSTLYDIFKESPEETNIKSITELIQILNELNKEELIKDLKDGIADRYIINFKGQDYLKKSKINNFDLYDHLSSFLPEYELENRIMIFERFAFYLALIFTTQYLLKFYPGTPELSIENLFFSLKFSIIFPFVLQILFFISFVLSVLTFISIISRPIEEHVSILKEHIKTNKLIYSLIVLVVLYLAPELFPFSSEVTGKITYLIGGIILLLIRYVLKRKYKFEL